MIARRGRYWIFLAGLPALLLADPIPSGTDALTAYTQGDYKTAMKLLRPMAEEGNTFAQFTIGKMYTYGEGVPKDPAKGMVFIRAAAEKGLAIAQLHMAKLSLEGTGVPKSPADAAT